VCIRHGAKVKLCSSDGCTNIAVKGGVCIRHGAEKKKRCSSEGCTKFSREECARGMGHRSNDAAVKDAQIMPSKEECALNMVQKSNVAAVKDAHYMFRKEECALSMAQRRNYAAVMDVPITPSVEECARGMGPIAIHTMNHLHLDQNTRRLPQLKPYPISVLLLERCHQRRTRRN
jgi:hypothetical protein